jgi:hypothetical protein
MMVLMVLEVNFEENRRKNRVKRRSFDWSFVGSFDEFV